MILVNSFLYQYCDSIDASVFSGDLLFSEDNRKHLKEHAERWLRAIAEHEAGNYDDEATS